MTNLRKAAQQAVALICSARLCEINSMSSRQEMLRLMIEATDTLRAALAEPEQDGREPLTDREIHDCFQQRSRDKTKERRLITRAIERAHGIGGKYERLP